MQPTRKISDPIVQFAKNAVRQANIVVLPLAQSKIERRLAKSPNSQTPEQSLLKIWAAEIQRVLGGNRRAAGLISAIVQNPPVGQLPLLADAQRLLVKLHLDENDFDAAVALSAEIDSMVIQNSESRTGVPMITRNPSEVSVETHLLEAEIALYRQEFESAGDSLGEAGKKLNQLENASKIRTSPGEAKQNALRCNDLRCQLHFMGHLLRIVLGDAEGFELLIALYQRLESDRSIDRRLLARIRAVQGKFDLENKIPPSGIGFSEARRLFALASREVFEKTAADFLDSEEIAEIGGVKTPPTPFGTQPLAVQTYPPLSVNSNQTVPSSPFNQDWAAGQLQFQTQITDLLERVTKVMEHLPVKTSVPVSDAGRRPFAFGGGFEFMSLPTQLKEAGEIRFTGFFQAQWSPEMIETSILAGNLNPAARCGEGFVFMIDGMIIDATLGTYDAPADTLPGTPEEVAEVRRVLRILMQIGLGIKLDNLPQGFGAGYPSMGVKARRKRVNYHPERDIFPIVVELDQELSDK